MLCRNKKIREHTRTLNISSISAFYIWIVRNPCALCFIYLIILIVSILSVQISTKLMLLSRIKNCDEPDLNLLNLKHSNFENFLKHKTRHGLIMQPPTRYMLKWVVDEPSYRCECLGFLTAILLNVSFSS